jgi:asparagine synthase (glutamine-hydrolysing)
MCGIAGVAHLRKGRIPDLERRLRVMNSLQKHRGPDGEGTWLHPSAASGLAHVRLSIIDLTTGDQPMTDRAGNWIVFNGEIYNYIELRKELGEENFVTTSDTEVILMAYRKWGENCLDRLRGMFAFAIWDEDNQRLFCARDHFGIKPLYFTVQNDTFYFASEIKALLPFVPQIETCVEALKDYLVFQLCLNDKTLFKDILELQPGHKLVVSNGTVRVERYWEIYYNLDFDHTPRYFQNKLRELFDDSVRVHLRSDVPVGAYLSGGSDSSIVAASAARYYNNNDFQAFHGKFAFGELYDESAYAEAVASMYGMELHQIDITSQDFIDSIRKVIYHLDYPVAGPGSFPQYLVSKLASHHRKVVLGGQGGDEIFGGYVRYLIAYFEQCIRGGIDGTLRSGDFIVTYESIIPNLVALQNYKPLLRHFWRDGLFDDLDSRYYRLVNRAQDLNTEIVWNDLGDYRPFETFKDIFNSRNVGKESYFDKMTHFDFKTLLPALLQVEDRMSMAHGLESRVPILDRPVVEFSATMPSNIKFKDGSLKKVLIDAMKEALPELVVKRKNKMGFPVPLAEWIQGELREFLMDIFHSQAARERPYFNAEAIIHGLSSESKFGRKVWGLLSLELWHQEFHDREHEYKRMMQEDLGI